jgi:hypothetical protein
MILAKCLLRIAMAIADFHFVIEPSAARSHFYLFLSIYLNNVSPLQNKEYMIPK